MTLSEILPLLLPLVAIQLILVVAGLYDLTRPDRRVRGGTKWIWGIVIVFGQLLGPLVYFLFGREDA